MRNTDMCMTNKLHFHVGETSIHQTTIERQLNCCYDGNRCLLNIFMMDLHSTFDPNRDYFDDFKFWCIC